MLENLQETHPQYRPSANFQFFGADSETFSASTISLVKNSPAVTLGYHGAHEPTYSFNPIGNINYQAASWLEIQDAMYSHLNHHRHLTRGIIDPFNDGALAKTTSVFGDPNVVSGLESFDPARAHAIDKTDPEATLFGYSAHIPNPPPNYFYGVRTFSTLLCPTPKHPTQVWAARHHMRLSGTDGSGNFDSRCMDGVASLQSKIALLDRSHPNVMMVGIGVKFIYAKTSPTSYAYDHPLQPELPPGEINDRVLIETHYTNTEDVLDWLVNDFFPLNPGSRFLPIEDFTYAFSLLNGEEIERDHLFGLAQDLIDNWDTTSSPSTPPIFAQHQGAYLSLSDMLQCMVGMVDGFGTQLQASVTLNRAIGPTTPTVPSSGNLSVDPYDLITTINLLHTDLNSSTWIDQPSYQIPHELTVGSVTVNAAEFLYLCAQLFLELKDGQMPLVVTAPASNMIDPQLQTAQDSVSNLSAKWPYLDWDLKPAILNGFPPRLSFVGDPVAGGSIDIHLTDDPGSEAIVAIGPNTTSHIIPGVGLLEVLLKNAVLLPSQNLARDCFTTWQVSIPASFHGNAYAQALSTKNNKKELSNLLTISVP